MSKNLLVEWYDSTIFALKDLWQGFLIFTPKLIGAILVFIIGWMIATVIARIVSEILKRLRFDKIFERRILREALEKANLKIGASEFVGVIAKWIIIIVFLSVSAEILGLSQFSSFVNDILNYIPNVIIAALIFIVIVVIVDIAEKLVRAGVESAKINYGGVIVAIVRWSIWIFAVFAILYQLNVAPGLIQTLVQGIVGFLVISAGLAFGLGGKEVAAEILQGLKKKIEK